MFKDLKFTQVLKLLFIGNLILCLVGLIFHDILGKLPGIIVIIALVGMYMAKGVILEKYAQWYVKRSYSLILLMAAAMIAVVFAGYYFITGKSAEFLDDNLVFLGILLSTLPITAYKLIIAKKYNLDKYHTQEEVEADFPPFIKF